MPKTRDILPAGLRSRLGAGDLVVEALGGVFQRPGRSVLTMLGTVLGIGAFIAIIGISQTVGGQIGKDFSLLDATQVTVVDEGARNAGRPVLDFPVDGDDRVRSLNGVVEAGTWWQVPTSDGGVSATPDALPTARVESSVYAATAGLLAGAAPEVTAGVVFNSFHDRTGQNVAVLGAVIASQLGIGSLTNRPAIFIDGRPFTVIGIISACTRLPQLPLGVIIPASIGKTYWGAPPGGNPAQMLVVTRIGAARTVAAQVPVALQPVHPRLFTATAAPDPVALRHAVQNNLSRLFLLLAAVAVVVGALGIANTTLVAVLERAAEIGLRRSLGARPVHIAAQFLTEAGILGLLGGLIGASLGVLTTLGVAIWQHWSALISSGYVLLAPVAGALIGVLAGLYPALRASAVEPADALRR